MADLRRLGEDLESRLDPPGFDVVHARVRRIRRRRNATMTVVAAVVVLLALFGLTRGLVANRSTPPVAPAPTLDPEGAHRVLADPNAMVDTDTSRVDGTGAMLAVVHLAGATTDCTRTAMRWTGPRETTRAWLDVRRRVKALPAGFVVAASHCADSDHAAYLVDRYGLPHPITWGAGAESVCGAHPGDPRCAFDLRKRTGSLVDFTLPRGAHLILTGTGRPLWASSAEGRELWWSFDGRTWKHHGVNLVVGGLPDASAAGRYAVISAGATVEATSDAGATWHRRDLRGALSGIRTTDIDWTMLPDGNLLGETQLLNRGDVLFRSTDPSWTSFVNTPVRTAFGLVRPTVEGGVVYVVDEEQYAVSRDSGAHWRRTPPLP
jgi:hypothetical protein